MNNFTFTGRVTITLQCTKLTKKIVLNFEDLEIFSDKVKVTTNKDLRLRSLSQVVDTQTATNSSPSIMSQRNINLENPAVVSQTEVNRLAELQPNPQDVMAPIHNTSDAELMPLPNPVPPANLVPPSNPLSPSNPAPPSNPELPPNPILPPNPEQSPIPVPTVAGLPTSPQPTPLTPLTLQNSASQPILNTNPRISENNLPIPDSNKSSNTFDGNNTNILVISPKPSRVTPDPSPTQYTSSPDSLYATAKIINVDIKKQEENRKMSTYTIHLANALQPGANYTLDIEFSGKILNNLVGLYTTSYTDSEGRKR